MNFFLILANKKGGASNDSHIQDHMQANETENESHASPSEICRARETNSHCPFKCRLDNCNETFVSFSERKAHERGHHGTRHNRIQHQNRHHCFECQENFFSEFDFYRHARERQHNPYACSCGSLFSRLDVLNRHLKNFGTDLPQYPCTFCKRHRGVEGFRRKDHLLQHLKQYHHHETDASSKTHDGTTNSISVFYPFHLICTHSECPQYRGLEFEKLPLRMENFQAPFRSQSEFTKHMREEHNECTFPCKIDGCPRVGRRGYFREKDLIKHHQKEHPEEETYIPLERSSQCTEPACYAWFDPYHGEKFHLYAGHLS